MGTALSDWPRHDGRPPFGLPGGSSAALRLRAIAEDHRLRLHAQAPRLVALSSLAAWQRADLAADIAVRVLAYHAEAAVPAIDVNTYAGSTVPLPSSTNRNDSMIALIGLSEATPRHRTGNCDSG